MYTSDARLYHPVSTQRVTVSVQATEVVGAPTVSGGQPPLLLSGATSKWKITMVGYRWGADRVLGMV